MGYRGRGSRGYYPGNGPFRDLPPWQRPGWAYGAGAVGADFSDAYSCARFPWLPRRWWANPDANLTPFNTVEQSKSMIELEIAATEKHVETLRKKLDELETK